MKGKTIIRMMTALMPGFIILTFPTVNCTHVSAQMQRTRLLVDTVQAISMMQERVESENSNVSKRISGLQNSITKLEKEIGLFRDTLNGVESLMSSCTPKVKDKTLKETAASFLTENLTTYPEERIVARFNPKDLKKIEARKVKSDELDKLIEKRKKKAFKNLDKGDFTDSLFLDVVSYRKKLLDDEINNRTAKVDDSNAEINRLQTLIKPVPNRFDRMTFRKLLKNDEIPTKFVVEEVTDPEYEPYSHLMKRYYSMTSPENIPNVTGRFNGIIEDRITVFPLESSRRYSFYQNEDEYDCLRGSSTKAYRSLLFVSENGSIPDYVFTDENMNYNILYDIENGLDIQIEPLNEIWNLEEDTYTGFLISVHLPESTCSSDYTYVLENGNFFNRAPLNPKYMKYDECIGRMKIHGSNADIKQFNYRDPDWDNEYTNVNLVLTSRYLMGLPEDNRLWIKSSPAIQPLEIDRNNFYEYKVLKDFFGNSNDGLAIIYNNTGRAAERTMDVYRYSWYGPAGEYLNGVEIEAVHYWEKKATGKFDPDMDEWVFEIIEDPDNNSTDISGYSNRISEIALEDSHEAADAAARFRTVQEVVVVESDHRIVEEEPENNQIFTAVEQNPEFPGGQAALARWLESHILYPEAARQNEISGRVIVRFVVERDGSVGQATIMKGIDKDLDREALRVVKSMPKWNPGKNNGQAVRSYFTLPVTFNLQKQ